MSLSLIRPPSRQYLPANLDRLDAIGAAALALLAEEPDHLADLIAMLGRRPPPGAGWHGFPRLRPKIMSAAGLPGCGSHGRLMLQWSLWRLALAGRIELAGTAVRGSECGRIRFARIAPATDAVSTPSAHEWAVSGAHAEAPRI
jgi:hypothetical protein